MKILPFLLLLATASLAADPAPKPLRALLVTGGCCHDYEAQKKILSEGISARANVEFTIVHEGVDARGPKPIDQTAAPDKADPKNHRVSIYEKPDWANGYDVIVHNECFGNTNDAAFVEGIAAPHKAGVPGVMLHCSTHSYRTAPTDAWRMCVGQSSFSHEKARALEVKTLKPEHPVMIGFPAEWRDPADDELYKNEKLWPEFVPLAQAYGVETKKDHAVIWVNTYGQGKIFGTTLGHSNATMSAPEYLDLVTRGLLWACGKLGDDGKPAPGFGPASK